MVQRLAPRAGGVDEDLQIALGLLLTDELGQGLRPQGAVVDLPGNGSAGDDAAVDQALIRLGDDADLSAVIRAALQELGR